MKKTQWKGTTLLAPIPPVLVTCGDMEHPNIFTVAWTGIINTQPPKTYISVRPSRFSYPLIEKSGEFAINLPTAKLCRAVDFCGVRSGANVNKWEACRLTPQKANVIAAPMLEESPISLECRVFERVPLGTHDMFLADIVAVNVAEELIDPSGRLCVERADLLAFAHGAYFALGQQLGTFGFSVKKKKRNRPIRRSFPKANPRT